MGLTLNLHSAIPEFGNHSYTALSPTTGLQLLIAAFAALPFATLLYSVLYYLADVHRLRRFPSPSLTAASAPLWMMWYNAKGKMYEALDVADQNLGPVLRAYKDIYGHDSPILKDIFYDNLANGNPSMGDATDRQLHSIKRKNLSSIFSAKNILSMGPKVTSSVEELLAAIRIKMSGGALSNDDKPVVLEGVFDIQPWLNMFSYDVISKMLWSSSYGFLKCGSDDCNSMAGDGRVMKVPAIRCFQAGVQFNALCAHLPPPLYQISRFVKKPRYETTAADHFSGMVRYGIVKRMERELIAECGTFLNAGNDTIQITLTNTIYELASHLECQQKLYNLRTESLPKQSQPIASYMELSKIPFLTVVLDETYRLLPLVRFNLPRIIVRTGAVIAGHHVAAGVTVSSSEYMMHRDESLESHFSDVERRKACIGRNLACMEISVCIAALVIAFG
ncbi:cytochrome P450 [Trichoderma compactum]